MATTCVWADGHPLAEASATGRSASAQRVLAQVDELLADADLAASDLELIVAGRGPGTFTGLRIGLATARGLGFALGIPVRGVSTLDALRRGAGPQAVACIDARRGEVFAAGPGIDPCVAAPADLAGRLAAGALLVGDGAVRHRDRFPAARIPAGDSPLHVPWARHHAALHETAGPPEPLYLRAPDADRSLSAGAAA